MWIRAILMPPWRELWLARQMQPRDQRNANYGKEEEDKYRYAIWYRDPVDKAVYTTIVPLNARRCSQTWTACATRPRVQGMGQSEQHHEDCWGATSRRWRANGRALTVQCGWAGHDCSQGFAVQQRDLAFALASRTAKPLVCARWHNTQRGYAVHCHAARRITIGRDDPPGLPTLVELSDAEAVSFSESSEDDESSEAENNESSEAENNESSENENNEAENNETSDVDDDYEIYS